MHYKLHLQQLCAAAQFSLKDHCVLSQRNVLGTLFCQRRSQHAFAIHIHCQYLLKQKCYSSILVISVYHLLRTQLLPLRLSCRKPSRYELETRVNLKIIFISLGAFITGKLIQYNLKSYLHTEETPVVI